jgi:fatty acid desaturase
MPSDLHNAPQWFQDLYRSRARRANAWIWTQYAIWILHFGLLFAVFVRDSYGLQRTAGNKYLWAMLFFMFAVRIVIRARERGRRYEEAARVLEVALVRYEVNQAAPLRGLENANQEAARVLGMPLKASV